MYFKNSKQNAKRQEREMSKPARETEGIFHGKATAHLKQNKRQQIQFADSANPKEEKKDDLSTSDFLLQSVASFH